MDAWFQRDRQCSSEHSWAVNPRELQDMLDELEASRASRKRAWENLAEIRWVLTDVCGIKLPPRARTTIDLKGRIVKDGFKKAIGTDSSLWPS